MHYVPCLCIIRSNGTFVERGGGDGEVIYYTKQEPLQTTTRLIIPLQNLLDFYAVFVELQYLTISGT